MKTIKPTTIGGVAGGQKFTAGGILFKIAGDSLVKKEPPFWMYGGRGKEGGKRGGSKRKKLKKMGEEKPDFLLNFFYF